MTNAPTTNNGVAVLPHYQRIKQSILRRIHSGELLANDRLPSEHEFVAEWGVSRMTVNRALRELTAEGVLTRVQGAGTYVAPERPQSTVLEIRDIRDDIAAAGQSHSALVVTLETAEAGADIAADLGLTADSPVYHSVIVHHADGRPVQLEDRFINPVAAPGYMEQDFTRITPTEYLMRSCPVTAFDHVIEAVVPSAAERRLLKMPKGEPCLALLRTTWSGGTCATRTRMLHPGSRHVLRSGQRPIHGI